jgi:hypothetical protein
MHFVGRAQKNSNKMTILSLPWLESLSIIMSVWFRMEDSKLNTTYVSQITKVQTEFEHTRNFQIDLGD